MKGNKKKPVPSTISNNGAGSTATATLASQPKKDIFDNLEALRMSQDFESSLIGVQKKLLTVPIKKPAKEWWFRTHAQFELMTGIIELKEEREVYLVAPELWEHLRTESTFGVRLIVGAVNRQNTFFVWPLRLPDGGGKDSDWARSAREAAAIARDHWVRLAPNMNLGSYEVLTAVHEYGNPVWPTESFSELLRVAFKNYLIDSPDHAVLKRLRGEQ